MTLPVGAMLLLVGRFRVQGACEARPYCFAGSVFFGRASVKFFDSSFPRLVSDSIKSVTLPSAPGPLETQ